jgi:hypothetical protein
MGHSQGAKKSAKGPAAKAPGAAAKGGSTMLLPPQLRGRWVSSLAHACSAYACTLVTSARKNEQDGCLLARIPGSPRLLLNYNPVDAAAAADAAADADAAALCAPFLHRSNVVTEDVDRLFTKRGGKGQP